MISQLKNKITPYGLIVITILCLSYWLISNERIFIGWDARVYYGHALQVLHAFSQSAQEGIESITMFNRSTHNAVFTLPLIPILTIIGSNPHQYLSSLVLIYLIPACLITYEYIRILISDNKKHTSIKFSAAVVTLCAVPFWLITFNYKPDIGGMIFCVGALLIFTSDPNLLKVKSLVLLIFLTTLGLLFRRYYGYFLIAIYAGSAISVCYVDLFSMKFVPFFRKHRPFIIKLFVCGIVSTVLLFMLAPKYAIQFVSNDYGSAYSAYELGVVELITRWSKYYGITPVATAIIGLIIGARLSKIHKQGLILLVSTTVCWTALWLLTSRQGAIHYTLNPVLLSILTGNAFLIYFLIEKIKINKLSLYTPSLIILLAIVILPMSQARIYTPDIINQGKLALHVAPKQNHKQNWDAYLQLTSLLRDNLSEKDVIYVASSSSALNNATLKSADELLPSSTFSLDIMTRIPQVDKRDISQMGKLFQANTFVITDPVQYHLSPDDQKIVAVISKYIRKTKKQGSELTTTPIHFKSTPNFIVRVFHTKKSTSLLEKNDFIEMLTSDLPEINDRFQLIDISDTTHAKIGKTSSDTWWLSVGNNKTINSMQIDVAILGLNKATQLDFTTRFSPSCITPTVELIFPFKENIISNNYTLETKKSGKHTKVQFPLYKTPHVIMRLNIERNENSKCSLLIKNMIAR